MPPFTEKESSILAVLKKKSGRMSAQEAQREARVQARENSSVPPPDKAQVAQVWLQTENFEYKVGINLNFVRSYCFYP